jgi:hypothetical protein
VRLIVEITPMTLECGQERHHLTEHFLVGVGQLHAPLLEQRVVANIYICVLTHM